jgi:hypothetical protein
MQTSEIEAPEVGVMETIRIWNFILNNGNYTGDDEIAVPVSVVTTTAHIELAAIMIRVIWN